jgi:hypothetical membrane protein
MKPVPVAVVYFIAVIFIAHFYAPPGYIWTRNTISELVSQGHNQKWIMQVGFIGFGLLLTGALAWRSSILGRVNSPDIPILLYGLSILVTGIFCAAPFDNSLSHSVKEAEIHSLFATIAGFALVVGIVWHLIVSPDKRSFHLVFILLVTGISILFGLAESGELPIGKGIIQRSLYLVSFTWLVLL